MTRILYNFRNLYSPQYGMYEIETCGLYKMIAFALTSLVPKIHYTRFPVTSP